MKKNILSGLVVGGLISGATALLFAPKSGKETRESITNSTQEEINLLLRLKEQFQTAATQAEQVKNLANTLIPEVKDGIEKDVEHFNFKAKPRLKNIEKQLDKVKHELNTAKEELNIER